MQKRLLIISASFRRREEPIPGLLKARHGADLPYQKRRYQISGSPEGQGWPV